MTLKLPLVAGGIDFGLYAICSLLYILSGVLNIKVLEEVFYLWVNAHIPVSLTFGKFYRGDMPWEYVFLALLNTVVISFVVGLAMDLKTHFSRSEYQK